jgi:hypothetical protein
MRRWEGERAMPERMTYLDRYLAGECEPVWDELTVLGAAVREEPLYPDALAVARETMRRARHNIGVLMDRLRALGYAFGYDWWEAEFRDMLEVHPPPGLFVEPQPDVERKLAELEALAGPIPLSLRAWYEQIGAVNFVGMYPVKDATDPNGFTGYVQFIRAGRHQQGRRFTTDECPHDLDPLVVDSLDALLRHARHPAQVWKRNGTYTLELAPDEWLKYGVSGGGPYVIYLPNAGADAPFEFEWHGTTFVNYLRICFAWAGFPGLECKAVRPDQELAFLTRELLPI